VFWWGDILTDRGRARVTAIAPLVDTVLLSYRGDLGSLAAAGLSNIELFLFGVSPRYHLQARDSKRAIEHEVVLVGTCYPERCAAIEALNRHLEMPVAVWGRSWRRCAQARARGPLALGQAQRVHATSRIALNIHHRDTRDGVNMKYFEIPAAGALQIVDHQPLMDEPLGDRGVVSYRTKDELVERVRYYLNHEEERAERAAEMHRRVLDADCYAPRLARLLCA